MAAKSPKLFQPTQLGEMALQHRMVLAPLTRFRNEEDGTPLDMAIEYYEQRASEPGTLLISEATWVARKAGGFPYFPGTYTDKHVAAWKKIVSAVHAKGSFIYLQTSAAGFVAMPDVLAAEGHDYVGAGTVYYPGREATPHRPLTIPEIKEYAVMWSNAAKTAIEAGFDGIEIHSDNNSLPQQFLMSNLNDRTDEYGGSVEGRCRFVLEILEATVKAIGEKRVGLRISPWIEEKGIASAETSDIIATFTYLVTRIRELYPSLSYLHVIEPRVTREGSDVARTRDCNNDFIREIWPSNSYIAAGGFGREEAIKTVEEKGGLIALGRHFLANPDLPRRWREGLPLNPYDRSTFYVPGSAVGYTDYPFYDEAKENNERLVPVEVAPVNGMTDNK